jgi:hypothetical protein
MYNNTYSLSDFFILLPGSRALPRTSLFVAMRSPNLNNEKKKGQPYWHSTIFRRVFIYSSAIMIAAKFLRLCTRGAPFNSGRAGASRFIGSTPYAWTPSDEDNNLLQQGSGISHLRLKHSVEPIPYTSGIELTPMNTVVGDKLGHQKITVVGCGQVSFHFSVDFYV